MIWRVIEYLGIDANIYKPYRKEDLMFFSLLLTIAGVAHANPENRPPNATTIKKEQPSDVPKASELLELAKKAVGEAAYAEPKPYMATYKMEINFDPNKGDSMVGEWKAYYKDKKWRADNKTNKANGYSFTESYIFEKGKEEFWLQVTHSKGVDKWRKVNGAVPVLIPAYNLDMLTNYVLEEPIVVKENGQECYRLDANPKDPKEQDWKRSYFFDAKTHLPSKIVISNEKTKFSKTLEYYDYYKVQSIAIPKQMLEFISDRYKGRPSTRTTKTTITEFLFKNDISDSLFIVPKGK